MSGFETEGALTSEPLASVAHCTPRLSAGSGGTSPGVGPYVQRCVCLHGYGYKFFVRAC